MTQPTQAQIEAALKEWNATHQKLHLGDIKQIAALSAPAEAGEPSKMFAYISGQNSGKIAELEAREEYALGKLGVEIEENEKLRAELAATIERCAQVVWEQLWRDHRGIAEKVVAAIRALKDK